MNDRDVAELRVDVADAGDGGAVVMHAAQQQHVARPERGRLVRVEWRRDDRVDWAAEGFQRLGAVRQFRVTDRQLAEHVAGEARRPQAVAQQQLVVVRHQLRRIPLGQARPQPAAQVEQAPMQGSRLGPQRDGVVAVDIGAVDRLVDPGQQPGDVGCRDGRRPGGLGDLGNAVGQAARRVELRCRDPFRYWHVGKAPRPHRASNDITDRCGKPMSSRRWAEGGRPTAVVARGKVAGNGIPDRTRLRVCRARKSSGSETS